MREGDPCALSKVRVVAVGQLRSPLLEIGNTVSLDKMRVSSVSTLWMPLLLMMVQCR